MYFHFAKSGDCLRILTSRGSYLLIPFDPYVIVFFNVLGKISGKNGEKSKKWKSLKIASKKLKNVKKTSRMTTNYFKKMFLGHLHYFEPF